MNRVIEGQVITTTHVDSHGECISREEMIALFNSRPPNRLMGNNHDLSKSPVCRSFNDRLEEMSDGELAWKADIEVFDEEAFSKFGGFSIGFTRRHVRFGNGIVEAKVTINTRQFDFETAVAEVEQTVKSRSNGDGAEGLVRSPHVVELVERVEKADEITKAIITISTFVSLNMAGGFFKAIGASLFEAAKRLRRKDAPMAPSEIHFHLHLEPERKIPMVLLVIDPACDVTDVRNLRSRAKIT
jgi:hypothetical protein